MPETKQKLRVITWVYWFLLVYILAALVWWFISLEQLNHLMYQMRVDSVPTSSRNYLSNKGEANSFLHRKNAQYIGEGIIFLIFIMLGAVFVYRATRKQLLLGQQQQNFMMAVTHELKTPISVVKLNVETLRKRTLSPEITDTLLKNTLLETERLNQLADNIILATRLDGHGYLPHMQALNLSKMVQDATALIQLRTPHIKWEITVPTHQLVINAEPLLINMLLSNLLENAAKYGKNGGDNSIELFDNGKYVQLSVADKGPGIPDEEKEKIFEKFYRIGNETTRKAKGSGLGLFLCQKIVSDHNGSITVLDTIGGGANFVVLLPKA